MEPDELRDLDIELRAKYDADELAELGKKGQVFKNENGDWSYPIKDEDDVKKAIRAVGRGGADYDKIRAYVIKAAKKIGHGDLISDNWNVDGSVKESEGAWSTLEQRDTAMDVFTALESLIQDAYADQYGRWCVWVQDWFGGGETGYQVVYQAGGDLYSAPFGWDDEHKIQVNIDAAVKVRPITDYVEREPPEGEKRTAAWAAREQRKAKAELLDKTREVRDWQKAFGTGGGIEIRKDADDDLIWVGGYASITEHSYDVGYYKETIDGKAFKRTLGEGPDTVFLVNHAGGPLARTVTDSLKLDTNHRGDLRYDAGLQPSDPDVLSLVPKLERKDISESSFAFLVRDQEWNSDYTERRILDVSLHKGDVSAVTFGANDATSVGMRAIRAAGGVTTVVDALLELRAGKALSGANEEALGKVLELIAAADEGVDEAQPLLARVLGVPNPDEPEGDDDDEEGGQRVLVPSYTSIARAKRDRLMRAA